MGCNMSKLVPKRTKEPKKVAEAVNDAAPPPRDQHVDAEAEAEGGGEGKEDKKEGEEEEEENRDKCNICWETKAKDGSPTVRACTKCKGHFCVDCIRQMFTRACVNTTEMPPQCCVSLNVAVAIPYLTTDEIELFKSKYEESRTVDPVYCPVSTCSAFISYRLFPKDKRRKVVEVKEKEKEKEADTNGGKTDNADGTTTTTEKKDDNVPQDTPQQPQTGSTTIACPKCTTQICCDCKLLAHKGTPCTKAHNGLDANLQKFLLKYRIKRCPRCRSGVRRMFGCRSMLCLCGCQWCWDCRKSLDACQDEGCATRQDSEREAEERAALLEEGEIDDGSDDDDDDDDGDDDNDDDEDQGTARRRFDLDAGGRNAWDDDNGFDFGEEADNSRPDQSSCRHNWILKTDTNTRLAWDYRCEQCWRAVKPQPLPFPEASVLMDVGHIPEVEAGKADDDDQEKASADPQTPEGYYVCRACNWLLCSECQDELT